MHSDSKCTHVHNIEILLTDKELEIDFSEKTALTRNRVRPDKRAEQ